MYDGAPEVPPPEAWHLAQAEQALTFFGRGTEHWMWESAENRAQRNPDQRSGFLRKQTGECASRVSVYTAPTWILAGSKA